MEAKDFCYWLQGYLELSNANSLTEEQIKQIKEHLNLVFTKVTSSQILTQPCSPGGSSLSSLGGSAFLC